MKWLSKVFCMYESPEYGHRSGPKHVVEVIHIKLQILLRTEVCKKCLIDYFLKLLPFLILQSPLGTVKSKAYTLKFYCEGLYEVLCTLWGYMYLQFRPAASNAENYQNRLFGIVEI
jgi:hypothetical protein